MRLLVTGGAGFIGSNFIRGWLSKNTDDTIVNFDAETYAGDRTVLADVAHAFPERYAFVHGDVCDIAAVRQAVRDERPDIIVNFAAESHNSRAVLDPLRFLRTNALGTEVLLEVARQERVLRFHQVSTCEVYGDLPLDEDAAFTEASPYRPRTPYNASKAAGDLVVRAYHETYELATTISISCNNYGPWQHPEKLIPLFVTNAIDDLPLPLYRSSQNRREWMHVDDHCDALDLIIRHGRIGETYNVGSGEERSIEQVADMILERLRRPPSLKRYVADRPGHDRRYLLDHSKIARDLGWTPRVPFEAGLDRTIEWLGANRPWWGPKKDRIAADLGETGWAGPPPAAAATEA